MNSSTLAQKLRNCCNVLAEFGHLPSKAYADAYFALCEGLEAASCCGNDSG